MKKITILIASVLIINANNTTDEMKITPFTLTKTSATVVIKNKKAYSMGEDFRIEKKVENQWKEVQFLNAENIEDIATFPDIAIIVQENSKKEFELDWTKMYGGLEKESYRVVKQISAEDGKKYYMLNLKFNTEKCRIM